RSLVLLGVVLLRFGPAPRADPHDLLVLFRVTPPARLVRYRGRQVGLGSEFIAFPLVLFHGRPLPRGSLWFRLAAGSRRRGLRGGCRDRQPGPALEALGPLARVVRPDLVRLVAGAAGE